MSRQCLKIECHEPKQKNQLFCRAHWRSLPQGLKNAVWRAYSAEPGSEAHVAAVKACVRHLKGS